MVQTLLAAAQVAGIFLQAGIIVWLVKTQRMHARAMREFEAGLRAHREGRSGIVGQRTVKKRGLL